MTSDSPHRRRQRTPADAARRQSTVLLLLALLTGAGGVFVWTTGSYVVRAVPAPVPVAFVQAASAPVGPARIDIGAIGVSAYVESVVRNGDGTLATPRDWNNAGWYAEGAVPGEPGPAILVGHRDSAANGPAVFFRLGELTPGDEIAITESDGTAGIFVVDSLRQVAKGDFPTEEVYGPSAHRLLRLITCAGRFDFDADSYLDNLVVTAHAV